MTEEKQNIAIYKLLGYEPRKAWRVWYDKDKTFGSIGYSCKEDALNRIKIEKTQWPYTQYPEEYKFSEPEEYDDWGGLPEVNLDLLNKVEMKLAPYPSQEESRYIMTLTKICNASHEDSRIEVLRIASASIKQRREALLKTLNLWEG